MVLFHQLPVSRLEVSGASVDERIAAHAAGLPGNRNVVSTVVFVVHQKTSNRPTDLVAAAGAAPATRIDGR
jgi:hypothetical protein